MDLSCTVSRPGLAHIAAGHAVELFASARQAALQHHTTRSGEGVPSQVRGTLSPTTLHSIRIERYEHCVACSDAVLQACLESEMEEAVAEAAAAMETEDGVEEARPGTGNGTESPRTPGGSGRTAKRLHAFWCIVLGAGGPEALERLSGSTAERAVAERFMKDSDAQDGAALQGYSSSGDEAAEGFHF